LARPAEVVTPVLIGCLLVKRHANGICDSDKGEVFISVVRQIDVSSELKNEDGWFCCPMNYFRFIWARKEAQFWRWRWVMMPGIGCLWK